MGTSPGQMGGNEAGKGREERPQSEGTGQGPDMTLRDPGARAPG